MYVHGTMMLPTMGKVHITKLCRCKTNDHRVEVIKEFDFESCSSQGTLLLPTEFSIFNRKVRPSKISCSKFTLFRTEIWAAHTRAKRLRYL